MGTNNSKQAKGKKRDFSSQSISTELDNSSSSYYSNYEELRQVNEGNCLACNIKKSSKPNWLKFYHSKCDKMILSNIPWAYDGKLISELKGKIDYRYQYEEVFQANLRKLKTIMSNRPSVHQEPEPPQNMNNLLADLDITTNANEDGGKFTNSKQKIDATPKQKRSEKNFGSHQTSNNDNDFYSVKSDLMSNPTPINNIGDNGYKKSGRQEDISNYQSCKSNNNNNNNNNYNNNNNNNNNNYNNYNNNNNQKEDQNNSGYFNNNQNAHNNSFPSYMLENQFQGLRAGNITMMKMNDPESMRKNLNFYFECTSLISQHLDDANFTLYQIRNLFITSFYTRYSEQIKLHREQLQQQLQQKILNDEQKANQAQARAQSEQGQYSQFQQINSLPSPQIIPVYQDTQEQNQQNQYIYNNISSQRFSSEEKFSPLSDAFRIYKNALREFQYFVKIFMEVIKQYYDIHYKKNQKLNEGLKELFSYHNFQNFIISKLFQNEKIPKILIELIKLVIPDDKDLINHIDKSKLTPQMFGIPSQYSLDDETKKILGCTPFASSDAFGSIKEEFEDFDEKSLHQQNMHLTQQYNSMQAQKIQQQKQQHQGNQITDQNAINSDNHSHKEYSYSTETDPSSKFSSHQKLPFPQAEQKDDLKANQNQINNNNNEEEEEYQIGESDEDQDIIFELKISNKARNQFTPYYQQNDPLRGNSNIFTSEISSQYKQEIEKETALPNKKINPYQKCLDYIEQMRNSTTPTGKFKSIILACESIEKCIIEFYKQNGRVFNQTLDEESIISILTYLIAQTGINGLEAHCKFVHSFYKNPTKKMKLKYYLIAFEISVRNMQELYYHKSQQEKQSPGSQQFNNSTQDTSADSTKSAKSIFKKNLNKKLVETFGDDNNTRQLMNITGRNSILKRTLAEVKQ